MSIRFDRESVQQFWGERKQGATPNNPLGKALADNQLSRKEYESLKADFAKSNPGEDFDRWLADALDGQLDQRANAGLQASLAQLGRSGSATESISFALNDAQTGFESVAATGFENSDWLQAAQAADGNKNGRIDANERAALQGKVDGQLLSQLSKEGAVLTYDMDKQRLSFYPAPDAPQLQAHYRDLKLDIQVDLKDVDGISDLSRNDLSGQASGTLHFDWSGPLTRSIEQGVTEKSRGVFDSQARYVAAGDKNGYGPGYVIQAGNSWVSTRPIILKTNPQGELYVASPGFGEWARLKMGEYGLEKYALPQLKAMGFEMEIDKRDEGIFLKPKKLQINHVPLSAQGSGQGQLNLDMNGKVRFSVGPDGLRAHFDKVGVTGSSQANAAQAAPDRGADGVAAPDSLKGRFQAGLNYDPRQGRLDTQVVMRGTEALMNLSPDELAKVEYLPADLRQLAGEHLQAVLRMQGDYRTVNGQQNTGSVSGQLELTNRKGQESTDVFTRFETGYNGRSPMALSLSAVDVRHQRPGQKVRVQAEQGQVAAAQGAKPQVRLSRVKADADLSGPLLARAKKILSGPQPGAVQFQSALKTVGVSDSQLAVLSSGNAAEIGELMSSKAFVSRLEKALVEVEAARVTVTQAEDGSLAIQSEDVSVAGSNGSDPEVSVRVSGQATQVDTRVAGGDVEVQAQQGQMKVELARQAGEGRIQGEIDITAAAVDVKANAASVDVNARGAAAKAEVEIKTSQGAQATAEGTISGVQMHMDDQTLKVDADQLQGQATYTSKEGSSLEVTATGHELAFKQNNDKDWTLTIPDIGSRARLELQLEELKSLLMGAQKDTLPKQLAQTQSQADMQQVLQGAGLNQAQAQKAAALLWQPDMHQLLATSGFVEALQKGEKIELEVLSQGELRASENPATGVQLDSQAEHRLQGSLQDAEGQTLIAVQGDAHTDVHVDSQQTTISSPVVNLQAEGFRADGSRFAELQARINQLEASLGDGQRVTTGEASLTMDATTTLDPEKMQEIQRLLTDFRDDVVERLQALGLSREQFEQIINAFGKQQLEALFTSFKTEDIAALSADLGLSPEQIQQTLALLNDKPFQKLVQDLFTYNEVLNQAETKLHFEGKAQQGLWEQKDQQMLAQLNGLSARITAQTENDKGTADLQVDLKQDQLRYQESASGEKLDWQAFEGELTGQISTRDQSREARLQAQGHGGAGHVGRDGRVITGHLDQIEVTAQGQQRQADGSSGEMDGSLTVEQVNTYREQGKPDTARMEVRRIDATLTGELDDKEAKQTLQGQGQLKIESLEARQQQMRVQQTQISGQVQTAQDQGKGQVAEATARGEVVLESFSSGKEQGLQVPVTRFEGQVEAALRKGDQDQTRMRFSASEGQLTDLTAHEGKVEIDRINADLNTDLKTPMVRGQVGGELTVDGFQSHEKQITAQGFRMDDIGGKLFIDTSRLRALMVNSPDALAILETISQRWASRQGSSEVPNLFTNKEISLDISKGQWTGDASDGNALSNGQTLTGHLRFPDLKTQLGSGEVDLQLHNLSLANDQARPEVKVTGNVNFRPKQPEFNQAVQSLVDANLKKVGLDFRPQVEFKNGEFKVKIDRWYIDGLVGIDFDGDKIEMRIDKAKLLHFISAKGLATRFAESKLNDFMLETERADEKITLSLNEFSEQLLHKDNLQIVSVETRPDNTIQAKFAYTDTAEYNAAFRQRQETKIDERVFHDPRTGKARDEGDIEDLVEDLSPVRLQTVFKQASAAQVRKMLETVGNDYDDIVRRVLSDKNQFSHYSVPKRAIMAAYLANNSGFFESVDSQEKQLLKDLYASIKPEERQAFFNALSAEEQQRVNKYLNAPAAKPKRQPPTRFHR